MAKHEVTSLSFAGGLNKKADPKALKENQTTQADNVIYQTAGIVRKRGGFTTISNDVVQGVKFQIVSTASTPLAISRGAGLQNVNGELCFADNSNFYTFSEANNAWIDRGEIGASGISEHFTINSTKDQLFTTTGVINISYADISTVRCIVGQANAIFSPSVGFVSDPKVSTALIGFWDKAKNEWILPPASPVIYSSPNLDPASYQRRFLPKVVAHGDVFRIYAFRTASLGARGLNLDLNVVFPSTVRSTRDLTAVINNFSIVPSMVMTTSDGNPDFTCGLDAVVGDANNSYVVITGPSTFNSIAGTTGPTNNNIAVFNSPTAVVPFNFRQSNLQKERIHIAADSRNVLLTGSSGLTTILTGFAVTTQSGAAITINEFGQGGTFKTGNPEGGNYVLPGLIEDVPGAGVSIAAILTKQWNTFATTSNFVYGIHRTQLVNGQIITPVIDYPYAWPEAGAKINPVSKPLPHITVFPATGATTVTWDFWVKTAGSLNGLQTTNALISHFPEKINGVTIFGAARGNAPIGSTSLPNITFTQIQPTTLGAPLTDGQATAIFELNTPTTVGTLTVSSRRTIIPLDKGAFITGIRPAYYDGAIVRELGFNSFPELTFAGITVVATTGGLLGSTVTLTYNYSGIYRYFDSNGKQVLSAAFPTLITVTTAPTVTGQYVQFIVNNIPTYTVDSSTVPSVQNSSYTKSFQAVFYRTTADDDLNFRELGLYNLVATTGGLQYQDNTSDANLVSAGLPFLYSSPVGGELDNFPPPACSIAIASQQRLFVVSDEYPNRIYFSKPFASTRVPEFTSFFIEVDPNSGPITGLGVIDTNLIVFKEKVIYVVTGSGPDALGQGFFNDPVVLWSDDGCINPDSVLVTAEGIFYQSARGLQLMDRSQQNQYIGAQVEEYTRNNRVLSAIIVPEQSQVRFFMIDGTVLVYDYLLTLWSRFTSVDGIYANAATVWKGKPTFLEQAREIVAQETMDNFVDAGGYSTAVPTLLPQPITMTLETGWIKFAGLSTWNRLRRVAALGEFKTSNSANLSFAYDYNPTYLDVVNFTTGTVTATVGDGYHWRARTPRQVMQAVRFKLVDSPVFTVTATVPYTISNTAESYNLAGLTLEWATKGGISRMPDNKSK